MAVVTRSQTKQIEEEARGAGRLAALKLINSYTARICTTETESARDLGNVTFATPSPMQGRAVKRQVQTPESLAIESVINAATYMASAVRW